MAVTIGWLDLTVANAEGIRDFYAAVCNWGWSDVEMGGTYQDYVMTAHASGEATGGICHSLGQNAALPPVWIPYFQVDDLRTAIARCVTHGGTVLRIDERFAIIRDPAGATLGLWWPEPPAAPVHQADGNRIAST